MNKEQAAAALGITVRTLQRHMAAHRIGFAMRKTATGEEATFSAEEVARFKVQRDALTETVTPAANVSEVVRAPAQALERAGGEQGMSMLASVLADALRAAQASGDGRHDSTPPVELKDKLMLTEREAAAYAGLSLADIERARDPLKAIKTGAGWRVKRTALEAYVKRL